MLVSQDTSLKDQLAAGRRQLAEGAEQGALGTISDCGLRISNWVTVTDRAEDGSGQRAVKPVR